MPLEKRFVYVLKSGDPVPHDYVGLTADVDARTAAHDDGQCPHTAAVTTWRGHVVIAFSSQRTAARFERYLKSGSGRSFARRHFESD